MVNSGRFRGHPYLEKDLHGLVTTEMELLVLPMECIPQPRAGCTGSAGWLRPICRHSSVRGCICKCAEWMSLENHEARNQTWSCLSIQQLALHNIWRRVPISFVDIDDILSAIRWWARWECQRSARACPSGASPQTKKPRAPWNKYIDKYININI